MSAAATAAAGLAERVDALLPQTQCTRCGYPDCRAYAEAVAGGRADIDRCPPGGEATMNALASLLGRAVAPCALAADVSGYRPQTRALIDEQNCIGCTKCLQACPLDAIVGAAKSMHTVIGRLCSGCELCLPPCPVDCIVLVDGGPPWDAAAAAAARDRYHRRERRLAALATSGESGDTAPEAAGAGADLPLRHPEKLGADGRQAALAASLARARAARAARRRDRSGA